MKKIILVILFCGMAAAQAGARPEKEEEPIDPCAAMIMSPACGHISGNQYKNEYFGFSYTFPADWKPLDQKLIREVHQKQYEEKRANAFREAKGKPVMVLDSWDLMLAFKLGLPPSDAKPFNSYVVLWVDEISPMRTPADQLESSGFTADKDDKLLKPVSTISAGGRQFARADRLDHLEGRTFYHTRAVTFIRKYALGLDCYSDNQQEFETLVQTLQTLKFDLQPDSGTLTGNSYHNAWFGFTYQVPATLTPYDEYEMSLIAWAQRKQNVESLPSLPNVTVLSFPNYDLLAAEGRQGEKDGKVHPLLRVWAERNPLTHAPDDYFANSSFLMEEHLKGRKMPEELALDGRTFIRAARWSKDHGITLYTARVATVDKDLTLIFEFYSGSQKELDELLQSLNSLKFDQRQPLPGK